MRRIVLISCVKRKGGKRAKARELYTSDLFRKSLKYAQSLTPDTIYILSAKHGLLELDTKIKPYNETLKTMKAPQVKAWARGVLDELERVADLRVDRFIFLASERYRRYLLPSLDHYEIPMQGLGIGKQLHFLMESRDE
jgi:hypothetical protein